MNELYPEIEIIPDEYLYTTDTFFPKAASGRLPNLYLTWFMEIDKIVSAGYAADVTDTLKNKGVMDTINQDLLAEVEKDGSYYGIPKSAYSMSMMYNVNLFKEAEKWLTVTGESPVFTEETMEDEETGARDQIEEWMGNLCDEIKRYFNLAAFVGISSMGGGFEHLHDKLKEAGQALEYGFLAKAEETFHWFGARTDGAFAEKWIAELFTEYGKGGGLSEADTVLFQNRAKQMEQDKLLCKKEILGLLGDWQQAVIQHSCIRPEEKQELSLQAYRELKNSDNLYELMDSCRELMKTIRKCSCYQKSMRKEIIRAVEFMEKQYDKELSLGDVAGEVNLSQAYFSTLFKKELGKSFVEYLYQIRIEKAKEFLLHTDDAVYEISARVGFRDHTYFSRIFKEKVGESPGEFCSCIMLFSNLFNYSNSTRIIQNQMEEDILGTMKQAEYHIETLIKEIEKISGMVGTGEEMLFASYNMDSVTPSYANSVRNVHQLFENYLVHYDYLEGIFVCNQYDQWVGCDRSHTSPLNGTLCEEELKMSVCGDRMRENYPLLTLLGNYRSRDFIEYSGDTRVLTFGRLMPRTRDNEEYILYINVKEAYIREAYGNGVEEVSRRLALLDKDREILSSTADQEIGDSFPYAQKLSADQKLGKFMADDGENQFFYLNLENQGLTLIREMSMDFVQSGIRSLTKNLIIMLLLSSVLLILVYSSLMNKIITHLYILVTAMKEAGKNLGQKRIENESKDEIGFLISQFNTMNEKIGALIEERAIQEKQKRNLEIELLQSQINPHFLYNTLNMIKWMAKVQKADNISECVVALSKMLKPIFSNNHLMHSIKEEMEYLSNYIIIMNYRYGSHIKFHVSIEEKLNDHQILKFCLQPVIENAFTHGFEETGGVGEIFLSIKEENGRIRLRIQDSGKGISPEQLKEIRDSLFEADEDEKGHVGLKNVHRRLKLTFGEEYGINIESDGKSYTCISMLMPMIEKSGG